MLSDIRQNVTTRINGVSPGTYGPADASVINGVFGPGSARVADTLDVGVGVNDGVFQMSVSLVDDSIGLVLDARVN